MRDVFSPELFVALRDSQNVRDLAMSLACLTTDTNTSFNHITSLYGTSTANRTSDDIDSPEDFSNSE